MQGDGGENGLAASDGGNSLRAGKGASQSTGGLGGGGTGGQGQNGVSLKGGDGYIFTTNTGSCGGGGGGFYGGGGGGVTIFPGSCGSNGAGGGGSSFITFFFGRSNAVYGTVSTNSINDPDYVAFAADPASTVTPNRVGTSDVGGAVVIYIDGVKMTPYTVPGYYSKIVI